MTIFSFALLTLQRCSDHWKTNALSPGFYSPNRPVHQPVLFISSENPKMDSSLPYCPVDIVFINRLRFRIAFIDIPSTIITNWCQGKV